MGGIYSFRMIKINVPVMALCYSFIGYSIRDGDMDLN